MQINSDGLVGLMGMVGRWFREGISVIIPDRNCGGFCLNRINIMTERKPWSQDVSVSLCSKTTCCEDW